MTERGMIFNAEMVRAIFDGSKTQTRRIMKVQPDSPNFGLLRITESTKSTDIGKYHWAESNATGTHSRSALFSSPFGQPGDRIWVREAFRVMGCATDVARLMYYASERNSFTEATRTVPVASCTKQPSQQWTPSIHMPRWASRITLEITDVRVERLNSITEDDARSEGIAPAAGGVDKGWEHRINFRELWFSIYGADSWQANPWVWVIEFRRVEGEAA